ncbi:unnamed protein product [Urochloa decumbens]|uniref:F-box domain-containing protein n=1 Tax=Urochloa decumbens TaxID=240449 RepID=A0ABC9AS05_9POAL
MSFADLPEDNQRQILSSIPCPVDRGRMSLVCRSWRRVIRRHRGQLEGRLLQPPPPLPWLLLRAPSPLGLGLGSDRAACVLSGGRVHHFLDVAPHHARFFGSHDGAWLLLDAGFPRDAAPRAINVRTGVVERLPEGLLGRGGAPLDDMVVHAAALSSTPDNAACIAAAIVTRVDEEEWHQRRCIALWRKGWELAHEHVPPPAYDVINLRSWICDIVYHEGAFHMLAQGNHIRVCEPEVKQEYDDDLFVNWEMRRFQPVGACYDRKLFVHDRYLVVSRGELLLVLRFAPGPNQPTSNFKLYQATAADATNAYFPAAQYPWAWSELDTLGGRMLFIGKGCSRSYDSDLYPGFEAGIYLLDDGMFYDDAVIFGNGDATRYPCCDNGNWTEDGRVQRCFPRSDLSDHSAPVWLLP